MSCPIPTTRSRPPLFLATAVFLVAMAGCGEKDVPPPPIGKVVDPAVRSSDPGVSRIQEYAERATQGKRIDKSAADWRLHLPMRPHTAFEPGRNYVWTLSTDVGPIQIRLRAATAPEHTANVVYLTLIGFYDGLAIHTIVPGKGLETGDPAEDGKGSPGYAFSPESKDNKHDRAGLVSAISLGDSTDDSKFRITFAADPAVAPVCTIFGEVEAGFETLKKLEALGTPQGRPSKHVTIQKATISIR